jgi:hypothetical protein
VFFFKKINLIINRIELIVIDLTKYIYNFLSLTLNTYNVLPFNITSNNYVVSNFVLNNKLYRFKSKFSLYDYILIIYRNTLSYIISLNFFLKQSFSFSFYYLQGFIFLLFIDACLTDDEPLWEPIE